MSLSPSNLKLIIGLIYLTIISIAVFFLLSNDPMPQFRLLYIPLETPPLDPKNPCVIFLNLESFFDLIRFKTYIKFCFIIC